MNGKIIAGGLVGVALLAGGVLYYLQVYAFYRTLDPASAAADLRVATRAGAEAPLTAEGFEGIDSDSSPLRYRACFHLPAPAATEGSYAPYPDPTPLIAPGWFSCFDADRIGADLEAGTARAVLSQKDVHPGVDRVVAIYPDGRAYAWHQLNESMDE